MRWCLITGLFTLFAGPLFSQDSTVCIRPETARYFLEADDERWVLREKDSISNEIIYDQEQIIQNKDSIIYTFQQDSIICESRAASYEEHIAYVREQLIEKDREIKKQKLIKWGIMGVGIVALFLL